MSVLAHADRLGSRSFCRVIKKEPSPPSALGLSPTPRKNLLWHAVSSPSKGRAEFRKQRTRGNWQPYRTVPPTRPSGGAVGKKMGNE